MLKYVVALLLSIFSVETLIDRSYYIRMMTFRLAMMPGGEHLLVRPIWLSNDDRHVIVARERIPLGEVLEGEWGNEVLLGFWF